MTRSERDANRCNGTMTPGGRRCYFDRPPGATLCSGHARNVSRFSREDYARGAEPPKAPKRKPRSLDSAPRGKKKPRPLL